MLSRTGQLCLNVLLSEEKVIENFKIEGDIPRSWRIMDNGDVYFSRFRYTWLSKVLGGSQTVSFDKLVIQSIKTFSGIGKATNDLILNGLKAEYLKSTFDGEQESLIIALLMIYLVGFEDKGTGKYLRKEDFELSGLPVYFAGKGGYEKRIVPLSLFLRDNK